MNGDKTFDFPVWFFELPEIKCIESLEHGDELLCFFLRLWFEIEELNKRHGKRVFTMGQADITDEMLTNVFRLKHWNASDATDLLSELGMIIRKDKSITYVPFWYDKKDRSSPEYYSWRQAVLTRDNYTCRKCGSRQRVQAHHIIPWKDTYENVPLRYDIDNGISLCSSCHLKAHGGSWK